MPTDTAPAPHSPLLNIDRLTLKRGQKTLLRNVDWTVQPGENWVIMGPNGCGKTSLLRALTGFLTPSSGDISLLGAIYGETDWREIRRGIGLVSSSLQPHIPPAEPAIETVISGRYDQLDLWVETTPADIRAARRLLKQLDATEIIDREWIYLSQGERQRVLIARALAAEPQLLILDEPCAGLDPVARASFLRSLARLAADPSAPAIVLVTHHVEEITAGFSHALLLAKGRRVAAGPLRATLTSAQLSDTFGAPVTVRRRGDHWSLTL
ncbi:ABC transporter ATP-binding protein [Actomonas aquatica]|uniref:ABC transporter ATP-binding protein n=1 Tax=Actomonas aquatica TaxID=2866162 RepID=A0ABZ1CAW2_9BACT|nr:ABC transporter ATP-binding protein [Opitutus sp. WL0086]WRQ88729.1 ABC transporter ATP-binding protein [Opitutus sp. WL0086]